MSANGPQLPGDEKRGSPEELDPQLWQRIDALLSEALTLPEHERERWLSGLSEDDQPLAPGLRAILARASRTDGFMRYPVSPAALSAGQQSWALEREGTTVGPYRLLRVLGTGGMGQVWLAERVDGTIQRQVAIKLPRTGWALGMAERLQQERDALAALEHPNIARLYDAGTTETGRPYIAMEYVDGVPIDRYAITHSLTLRERLSLFLQVAGAVSYAHARLIVHRDLKPSNILVSESQGVRLLDFGAAKLLRDDVPGDSDLTRERGPALSPDYASPEQIRGERVTVATDVYSLGVVLYELLAGQRPYRLPRESWAALTEAVSRMDVPLASSRVGEDPKLARLLRGDLDAVLAKALRREAGERYPSVQAFADDVSRYLLGEPVRAKEQGVRERLWKFVRRHAIAVGTAVTVTLLVGAASGVAFWQARVARAQAARAERVRQFIASILTGAVPKTGVGGVVTASDLLSAAARRIESELSGEPAVAAELGVIVGDSFDSLGEPSKAEPVYRAAAARAEATFGRTHRLTLEAKTDLATELAQHDVPGALALLEEVIPDARKGLPATADVAVEALKEQSFALAKFNRPEASYAPLRESIQLAEKYYGRLDQRTISGLELLANTYARFGDRAKEMATATDAVDRARHAFGAQRPHNTLIATERTYADALRNSDRPADSAVILRGVVADQQRLDAAETMRVRNAKLRLGSALHLSGQIEEGLSLVREAVALEREQNPAESDDRLAFGMALASALASAERTDEWMAEEDRLAGVVARLGTETHRGAVIRRVRRARLLALLGKSAEAQALVTEADSMANPSEEDLRVEAELVAALDARLQLHLSKALARLERTMHEHTLETLPPKVQSDVAAELGTVRLELGDLSASEKELVRCRELFTRAQVEPSIPVSTCLVGAARLDLRQGRFAEAEQLLIPLATSWGRLNPDSPRRGEILHWLARAENGAGKVSPARRDAQLADSLLRRSKLPALRRLVETRLTAR